VPAALKDDSGIYGAAAYARSRSNGNRLNGNGHKSNGH
jgi:hypothetical protein